MASRFVLLTAFLVAIGLPLPAVADGFANQLSEDAANALHNCTNAVLYSLEPWRTSATNDATLHGFKILGQATLNAQQTAIAVQAFESATQDHPTAGADCFDPRHALRVQAGSHTYDFLLCYACHWLYVYRDNEAPTVLSAGGSPKILNALLKSLHVPVSKTGSG